MKLSFIILNYKSPHHLRICLEHIEKLQLPFPVETIVIDNASGDTSVDMVRNRYPSVRLFESPTNVGHPAGNNIGMRHAKGEYMLIVNPDIIFQDGADIVRMIDYADEHQDVAILGPKLHNPDGSIQHSCYRRYSVLTPFYRRTIFGKLPWARRDIQRHLMTDFSHNETIEVEWLLGACMLLRSSALQTTGFLNEKLFLYFGDYELCDRARQAGLKVVYFHETQHIIHYHKRESVTSRFSLIQAVSYVTRIHMKDWLTYLKNRNTYDKRT